MIWVSHPTGNTFVRALLAALQASGEEFVFHSTLAFSQSGAFFRRARGRLRQAMMRRSYELATERF